MRVAVQGLGNVGSVCTQELHRLGAKIVAVADSTGALRHVEKFDVPDLVEYVGQNGGVAGYGDGEEIDGDRIMETECDILVPAATQSQITADNVTRISARIIAEGANAPTTPAADEILDERGVFVIPDILCNAGGVYVSYLEYTQETQHEQWTEDQVNERLAERMRERFDYVCEYASDKQISMRRAAMQIGVRRVADATEARGHLP
jgi:glutamate dehydrogenase/leucine dehydrogenase